jgi:predicted naringenin-chalcone synthase
MLMLTNFSVRRPQFELAQQGALRWLVELHSLAESAQKNFSDAERAAFAERYSKRVERCACGSDKISKRGHVTADLGAIDRLELYDVRRSPRGQGTAARSRVFTEIVNGYFEQEYAAETRAPSELIHVTCTGYASPSGAQRLVAKRAWGAETQVIHAYHMGCYAAFPALRIAAGRLRDPTALRPAETERRIDIVHTELCTLHLDPSDHSAEQCVVQSLFADGFVRYCLCEGAATDAQRGLEILALSERILPDSSESMAWTLGDFGMQMTLARDVPERIAGGLRSFVSELFEKAGLGLAEALRHTVAAIHPGGPKIIDRVREVLELEPAQVQLSRDVLFDFGNMSSATLPHVWQRVLLDDRVEPGSLVLSLAFGPGLTMCGGLFRKH